MACPRQDVTVGLQCSAFPASYDCVSLTLSYVGVAQVAEFDGVVSWMVTPQKYVPLEPVNVTLFTNMVCADVIHILMMDHLASIQVGPKFNDKRP